MNRAHTERKTKDNIFTSDADTAKGETHSNNRECNNRSKRQRKVASNRPGHKLNQQCIGVNSSSSSSSRIEPIVSQELV